MRSDLLKRGAILLSVAAGLTALTSGSAALAQSNLAMEEARKQVSSTLDASIKAAQLGDVSALDKVYAPDATIIDSSGQSTWSEYKEKNFKAQMATMASNSHNVAVTKMDVFGDTAVLAFDYAINSKPEAARAALGDGPATAAILTGSVGIFGKGTMVLRRTNNEWKIVHVQTAGRALKPGEREKLQTMLGPQ
ncbi:MULTISPECIES: YybH family protein [Bradyrhizobium]|uniref:YybH family protein n=1 Tax=Bradyrhizobium TaxID=374 RepID=UPI000485C3B1|nr:MULTISPECIES: nuclear transport factor 2 family protein [Bradyrhizobium]MBR1001960.1 nuclear transport factor 2 family protein [Bradyrhizobium liaoningense]MCP1749188.1 ketosteroid isomerase-like protein [Bradyrhizobium japonicum]MCP1855160.1 ketosteroid isomerase-like protein [Bradyrhizobium japonicum]MCP1898091.1 ketosteroid isomerase-like protein [Bradyrhizobium japonicum]MCW2330976.1 ketosteroid isomerase-like protein [Bradyrhizobium japonicum]